MSNTPNNPPSSPFNPDPQDKGPWLYSGASQPVPAYVPPTVAPKPISQNSSADQPAAAPIAATSAPKPPSTSQPAKPSTPIKKTDDASLASIVDTIEAIIIALILALTFRAFIVEAFVIPTGSMAPTLLGAHFNVICPNCGYAFTRDATLKWQVINKVVQSAGDEAELSSNRAIPSDTYSSYGDTATLICPNCQYTIPYDKLPQSLGHQVIPDYRQGTGRGGARSFVPFAWANNGDRILVLKYLYAVLEPSRFDVIVFKEPMTAKNNYIKRLIGLPGETLEVINGDIYIAPPGKSNPEDMVIARKPPHIQQGLWQLVYNNDYYPLDEGKKRTDDSVWTNPWSGAGSTAGDWKRAGPVFTYPTNAPGMLQFDVRNHEPYTFNVLGYDNDTRELAGKRGLTLLRCGDLHLETVWTSHDQAANSLTLTLGQPHNQFQVVWSNGGLQLNRFNPSSRLFEKVETYPHPGPVAQQSYRVALDNVDRTVRFFIDGTMIFERETPWTAADATEETKAIVQEPLLEIPEIRIDVGGACELSHLNLARDLYYTQNDPTQTQMNTANLGNPLTLAPDEFFAMGDNSRLSADGRMWNATYPALDDLGTRRGIVPRRYLLGKAFFVYWPAGFRITSNDNIPYLSNIPLVPNTGEMRLIR